MRSALLMRLALCIGLSLLLISGCAAPEKVRHASVALTPENETAYVVPFVTTLVPESISESVFNDLVDALNDKRPLPGVKSFIILKDDLAQMNQDWLARQIYMTGDIWSYQENAGCCATELKIKARIALFKQGEKSPSFTLTIPMERFFEHDYSTLEIERERIARDLAKSIYQQLIKKLR